MRNLISSHQAILLNKNKTGAGRKSFQFFEEMNEILRKRHDINPPFASGSGCTATSTPKKNKNNSVSISINDTVPHNDVEPDDYDDSDDVSAISGNAKQKRKRSKIDAAKSDTDIIAFLGESKKKSAFFGFHSCSQKPVDGFL